MYKCYYHVLSVSCICIYINTDTVFVQIQIQISICICIRDEMNEYGPEKHGKLLAASLV